jgi:hypothetical protein
VSVVGGGGGGGKGLLRETSVDARIKGFLKLRQHVDYSHVTLDRIQRSALVNTVTKCQDPQTATKLLTSCVTISFSRASVVYDQ